MSLNYLFLFLFILTSLSADGQYTPFPVDNPAELGKVKWHRNYEEALKVSEDVRLPVFILFQEVPGCSNCTRFGKNVLSHPLIVEAIETCFVPLCIYNNNNGADQTVLKKYHEPAWNNPVIRIVDTKGKDIINREHDFNSRAKVIHAIKNALTKSGNTVPEYLMLLLEEWDAVEKNVVEGAYLSMYCFWSGEKEIAGMDGILSTEAGYMHGKEVVKVRFDTQKTNLDALVSKASKSGCADQVYGNIQKNTKLTIRPVGTYKKDAEDKYYLQKSAYMVIPMTDLQKAKVNRALALGQNPDHFLSPRQLGILKNKKYSKSQVNSLIESVWW
ncbi:MAG: thioredoxin family protein [Saprospiraceae bacterium]|nr:thioredoxin family protein [Saprospiraceae bacterium]